MQRQRRISDSSFVGTEPPIRKDSDKNQMERVYDVAEKHHSFLKDHTFSTESAAVRIVEDAKEYFKEYCKSTAIHGVRYFAEDGRFRIEKIFWVAAITLSLTACTHLIMELAHKWDSSPVIVSFAKSTTMVWQVPFPAVSICPETKFRQTKFNFAKMYNTYKTSQKTAADLTNFSLEDDGSNITRLTDEESERMEAVSLLCDKNLLTTGAIHVSDDAIEDLENVAPTMDDVFLYCRWRGTIFHNCSKLFQPVWSDEGICFTFNMLDNSDLFTTTASQFSKINPEKKKMNWDLENGYSSTRELYTFPYRAWGAGAGTGLFILLRAYESDLNPLCRGPVQGFKILLHNPAELPRVKQQYVRVPLNQEIIAHVKPSMMTNAPGLEHLAPHRRQCYFPHERQLRFFQVYTQKNCEQECIANFTLNRCGCVSFFMPRTSDTLICGPGRTDCTKKAFEETVRCGVRNRQEQDERPSNVTKCDCLASCVSLEYDSEISQAYFDWRRTFRSYRVNEDELGLGSLLSRITIFFKDSRFIPSHRSELYGITTFLADCGSLLGLFSGFSFISLIEILYFLTLRLWCRFERRRSEQSASQDVAPCGLEKKS